MKEFTSCRQAIAACTANRSFALSHLNENESSPNIHIHDCCEIHFFISGGRQFLINGCLYTIIPGDIFFINPYECHYLIPAEKKEHERMVICIHPDFLKSISSANTDLSLCFFRRESAGSHRLHLDIEMSRRFIYFFHQITDAESYGADILEKCMFTELLIFLNKLFHSSSYGKKYERWNACCTIADEMLSFIDKHVCEDLTLEILSRHFQLSGSYLCRIFKSSTGTTINKYITAKRITVAKSLLMKGMSVAEVCRTCGYRDYSSFLKSFTKAVGISPKKYVLQNSLQMSHLIP